MSGPTILPVNEDAPRWLLVLLVCLLLLLVLGGLILIQTLPATQHLVNRPSVLGHQGAITTVDYILKEQNPGNLVGREVALEAVPVQQVAGEYSFWLGYGSQRRIPALLFGEVTDRQPPWEANLLAGQRARVFGIVRDMREFTAFGTDPMLSPQQLAEIQRHPIFISARRIMTTAE